MEKRQTICRDLIREIIRERLELLFRLSEKDFIVPTVEVAIEVNREVMELFGGVFGIRDEGLLRSSIEAVFNYAHYRDEKRVEVLAFVLFERIIRNHPFIDGNKRTAVVLCEFMLRLNGIQKKISNDVFYQLAYAVARGEVVDPVVLSKEAFARGKDINLIKVR